MYIISDDATKKFIEPRRYVVYTHPGDVGSNLPATAATKKKHPPRRLFHDTQNGSVLHVPSSIAARTSDTPLRFTSTAAPRMKKNDPTSAAPHAISRFIHEGRSENASRGSMHDMLNTSAPMR